MIPNLWGELPAPDAIVAPLSILRKQAGLLSDMTRGMLVGEVRRSGSGSKGIANTFFITVPAMGNYSTRLITIDHGPFLYPVELYDSTALTKYTCEDQKSFEECLSKVLNSQSIRKMIQSLLSAAHASTEI